MFVQSPLCVSGDVAIFEPQEECGEAEPPVASVVPPKQGVVDHVESTNPIPSLRCRLRLVVNFSCLRLIFFQAGPGRKRSVTSCRDLQAVHDDN